MEPWRPCKMAVNWIHLTDQLTLNRLRRSPEPVFRISSSFTISNPYFFPWYIYGIFLFIDYPLKKKTNTNFVSLWLSFAGHFLSHHMNLLSIHPPHRKYHKILYIFLSDLCISWGCWEEGGGEGESVERLDARFPGRFSLLWFSLFLLFSFLKLFAFWVSLFSLFFRPQVQNTWSLLLI